MYMREAILARVFGKGFKNKKSEEKEKPLWKDLKITNGRKKGENLLYRIDNGTLIDHIEPGKGEAVMKVLSLNEYQETPMIYAKNLRSANFKMKDVIGIKDKELNEEDLSKLALVSSNATINIIRDSSVYRKGKVILPTVLKGLIQCNNLNCISRPEHHEHVPSKFYVENRDKLKVRCHYCEKTMTREEIRLK
ncbi:MAG: aspartate carbamoyltransferase regulatory subunit [archaeon]